jgi:LacI family transcriptional regulator
MGATKHISIVFPSAECISFPYFGRALKALKDTTTPAGWQCALYTENEIIKQSNDPAALETDGVVVCSPAQDWNIYLKALRDRQVPCVLIRRKTTVPGVIMLHDSDHKGTYLALEHLYALGHRTFGFLGRWNNSIMVDRRNAYCQFLQERGLTLDPGLMYKRVRTDATRHGKDVWVQALRDWVKQLFMLPQPPTAFMCYSDIEAIYLLNEIWRAGRRVPDDVALVSFDDDSIAKNSRPPLTTVRLPIEEMCEKACRIIMDNAWEQTPTDIEFENRLIVRESCGYYLAENDEI